jgi:ATP-dependent DNA ligase
LSRSTSAEQRTGRFSASGCFTATARFPVTFVAFDLLAVDGHDLMANPWEQRCALLDGLWVDCPVARLADVFDDGNVLCDAVVEHGLEGIVAKRRTGLYGPGYRGWVKIKNPTYWRRESEVELMQRRRERVAATRQ